MQISNSSQNQVLDIKLFFTNHTSKLLVHNIIEFNELKKSKMSDFEININTHEDGGYPIFMRMAKLL